MEKIIRVFIAGLLAVTLALTAPLQAFAAGKETYISEVAIETGSTAEEAKRKLEDAGYTVYDSNISNCGNSSDTAGYMYIGYKTTTDPDEAITDMRLMHMGGGYSYAEYEQILKQKQEEVGRMVEQLFTAVIEYRAYYMAEIPAAVTAYEMLNQLREDDSGLLMGDFFLDRSMTYEDYTKVLMQCSTAVLITIENALAIACSVSRERGLRDLADCDPEDFVGETQYEAVAADIYNDIPYVQNSLAIYANSGLTSADGATEEEVSAAFAELPENEEITWMDSFAFAKLLEGIELSDGSSLYDLVMTDPDELTTEDFYPLASVLSDGQAAMINVAGFKNVIIAALTEDDSWNRVDQYSYKTDEPISVYTGIDRSLFEGGVALTSKAMVEAAANTELGWFGSLDKETEDLFYKVIGISFFTFFGAELVDCILRGSFAAVVAANASKFEGIGKVGLTVMKAIDPLLEAAYTRYLLTLKIIKYAYTAFTYLAFISLGVILIAAAIYFIALGIEYYYPEYDEIPRILVEKGTEDDETVYTYYYGVKNTDGSVVDINQYNGSRWVSLYTSKDKNAGTPILADFVIQKATTLNGYTGVRKFSQDAAFDLNKFSYDLGSSVQSSYMFFKQAELPDNNFASVFSSDNLLTGICSLAAGLVLGIAGTSLFSKKRRKECGGAAEAPAAE